MSLRESLKIRFAVVPTGLQFVICLISRHLRGGLKAIVPAGTEFLEAPLNLESNTDQHNILRLHDGL